MIEAMKQVLEVLEENLVWFSKDTMIGKALRKKTESAIATQRQAIAEAEKQEQWKETDTAYRPGGIPQDFIQHEVDSPHDWSDWVCPKPDQYFMKCCDCNLVHEMQFKVVKYSEGDECDDVDDSAVQAVFRARRVASAEKQEPVDWKRFYELERKKKEAIEKKYERDIAKLPRIIPMEAEKQEPVAVVSGYYGGQCVVLPTNPSRLFNSGTALYTTPPAQEFVCSTGLCHFTLTQTNVGIGERGMESYEAAKKRGWVGVSDERLMEMPKQEPVAWKNASIRLGEELSSVGPVGYYDMTAEQWLAWALDQQPRGKNSLPQPQRKWVGLTDEDIWNSDSIMAANSGYGATFETLRELSRAIEAKLKEKNT